jgi:3-hydroxyacyl-[acyl-carrier-protein] dehydratase
MNRPAGVTPLASPESGPLFEGHFPGRPILPGIVLLHLALRADPSGGAGVLAGIDMLRFRRLVLPGERLEVHWRAGDAPDRIAVAVRRGDERVAEAVVRLGPAPTHGTLTAREAPIAAAAAAPADAEGVAPATLLPHGPAACFIESIRSESGDGVVCAARVPEAHPLTVAGSAPALVAIEMAAQAAGVFEARRRARGPGTGTEAGPRLGYLVGARDVRFARATLPATAACTAKVSLVGVAGALTSYEFEVRCDGGTLAAGRVSTWLTATAS